ncbi:ABC transporter permease [Actinocrispum sp. NPDC049592]|uniref:ABC transporter permease n=1 Tax=Actinocrispum sp. NPDC049592 TaxID=3154835 RepID=UPI00343DF27C
MTTVAVQAGVRRGWIEFRQSVSSWGELVGWVWPSIIPLALLFALRGNTVQGIDFSIGSQAVPGVLGMNVVLTGLMGVAVALTMDQMDGTLLRAKAIPGGTVGYLTGKIVSQTAMTVTILLIVLVPCAFLFDGIELGSASSWLTMLWLVLLGLLATLPIGAVLGSVLSSPQTLSFMTLLVMGLAMISGVFFPVTSLPEWLRWVAQVFPLYWMGLGMRSALLPDALAAAEIGQSWRTLETVGVLGAWAVLGFVVAPVVLRKVVRR